MNNISEQKFYQLVEFTHFDGFANIIFHRYAECSKDGLGEHHLKEIMVDYFNAKDHGNGLNDGYYWTQSQASISALTITPIGHTSKSSEGLVFAESDPHIIMLRQCAKEFFL